MHRNTNSISIFIFTIIITFFLYANDAVFADTIQVPQDFPTIQEAINAAQRSGDEIIVAPGTYNEAINLLGKGIYLHSSDGQNVTTIDGTGKSISVVTINGRGPQVVKLRGFTITGGTGTLFNRDTVGGGLYCEQNDFVYIYNCHFTANSADYGGGVYIAFSHVKLNRCKFTENTSRYGGGVYMLHAEDTELNQCEFDSNIADSEGGAIFHGYSVATITKCKFLSNIAREGAGIFTIGGSYGPRNLIIRQSSFSHNQASTHGGAIRVYYIVQLLISDSRFVRNTCGSWGGAISTNGNSSPVITHTDFIENYAGDNGGAINILGPKSAPEIKGCKFIRNKAEQQGGALYFSLNNPQVLNSILALNRANEGGVLFFNENCIANVTNCTLFLNLTKNGIGSSIATNSSNNSSSISVRNCILRSRDSDIDNQDGSSIRINYSNVDEGIEGEMNVHASPMFIDPKNDDFSLRPGSPCIDAGKNNALPPQDFKDFNENKRYVDAPFITDTGLGTAPIIDMGAIEFQADTFPTLTISPDPLISGVKATITLTNARGDEHAYLYYSLTGKGTQLIPQLNVTLDLDAPFLIERTAQTNSHGSVRKKLWVPNGATGLNFWFQAAQQNLKTNVIATTAQ